MVATRQRSPKTVVDASPPTTPFAFGTSRSAASTRPALIDCDLHNELHGDVLALVPYLPDRWKRTWKPSASGLPQEGSTRDSWTTAKMRGLRLAVAQDPKWHLPDPSTSIHSGWRTGS